MLNLETSQLTSVQDLRARARQNVDQGAVTEGYNADREEIIKLLNGSLATELVCVLRYKRHYFMAKGLNAEPAAAEFAEHASEEQEHADRIAERIVQLGGAPNLSPEGLLQRSHFLFHSIPRQQPVGKNVAGLPDPVGAVNGLGFDTIEMASVHGELDMERIASLEPDLIIGGPSSIFWNILAWTIIFGLTFSTVRTLIVVPCMY